MHDNLYNECIAVLKFKVKRMNKLEYIPGDLGTYNGNIVIIENSDGYYATYYDEDEFLQEVNVNVIESIPLTTAILEKNGWEHKDDVYFKDYPQRKLVIYDDKAYIINESCSLFLCKVEFVHQLQHLLFGLGLNSEMEV